LTRISISHALRAVLLALAAGWLVALVFGLWFARLQYVEVSSAFPPDKVATEYQARLDREIWQGPLLLLVQVGVMAGVLAWQIGATARRTPDPLLHGTVCGLVIVLIQGVIAALMHAPWSFTVPLVAVLIGTGFYAGWSVMPRNAHEA
jgi:hypothetical protein